MFREKAAIRPFQVPDVPEAELTELLKQPRGRDPDRRRAPAIPARGDRRVTLGARLPETRRSYDVAADPTRVGSSARPACGGHPHRSCRRRRCSPTVALGRVDVGEMGAFVAGDVVPQRLGGSSGGQERVVGPTLTGI